MTQFNLELPINSLSFGQMSFGILYDLFKRKILPNIFPIGEIDLNAYTFEENFVTWLNLCCRKALGSYKRTDPAIRLWHIHGSDHRLTDRNILWTAHETDRITPVEANILKQYDKVLVTSNYSVENFKKAGVDAFWCPNYFDAKHLHRADRKYFGHENIVTFGLLGKIEKRKNTVPILQWWAKKYGGNDKFRLNAVINNPFLSPEEFNQVLHHTFEGNVPWNISLLPTMVRNEEINEYYNSIDIDLSGLSGAEGWGLGCFNSLCLGKRAVVLNAHGHKDFANDKNSILVEPEGSVPIYDQRFFVEGNPFNQGNMFHPSFEEFDKATDKAVKVAKKRNVEGEKLAEEFNVKRTVDTLLNSI